jgi:hypothetical protein
VVDIKTTSQSSALAIKLAQDQKTIIDEHVASEAKRIAEMSLDLDAYLAKFVAKFNAERAKQLDASSLTNQYRKKWEREEQERKKEEKAKLENTRRVLMDPESTVFKMLIESLQDNINSMVHGYSNHKIASAKASKWHGYLFTSYADWNWSNRKLRYHFNLPSDLSTCCTQHYSMCDHKDGRYNTRNVLTFDEFQSIVLPKLVLPPHAKVDIRCTLSQLSNMVDSFTVYIDTPPELAALEKRHDEIMAKRKFFETWMTEQLQAVDDSVELSALPEYSNT